MQEPELHLDDEIPPPGTPEMARMIHSIIEQLLTQLPFAFKASDVMSASSVLLVDAGMMSVEGGFGTKEKLVSEITATVERLVEGWNPKESNVTIDKKHRNLQ